MENNKEGTVLITPRPLGENKKRPDYLVRALLLALFEELSQVCEASPGVNFVETHEKLTRRVW